MLKSKLFILLVILVLFSSPFVACKQSQEQAITVKPLEVPKEGSPGEYIDVIIQTSSTQPCQLFLSTLHKTEIDNYLFPYTKTPLTVPNSEKRVVFHEQIPWGTSPGSYILKVMQMRHDDDSEGTEIFSQTFIIR